LGAGLGFGFGAVGLCLATAFGAAGPLRGRLAVCVPGFVAGFRWSRTTGAEAVFLPAAFAARFRAGLAAGEAAPGDWAASATRRRASHALRSKQTFTGTSRSNPWMRTTCVFPRAVRK
jgi:hypothetical protein